jgi:DNA helicase MCM8
MKAIDAFAPLYLDGAAASESDRRIASMFADWFDDPDGGRPMLLVAVPDIGGAEHATFDAEEFTAAVLRSGLITDFGRCLRDQPRRVIAHVGLALVLYREKVLGELPARTHPVRVRFTGLLPELPLSSLKSSMVGKLVCISGYVVRVSTIQPLVLQARFECPKCGALTEVHFEDGKFENPTRCGNVQCRAKAFELRRGSAQTADHQRVKVQEVDNDLADAGRVPRTVEVELSGAGLVDSCIAGDLVTIVGIVKSVNADHAAGKGGKRAAANGLFILYILANSVSTGRASNTPRLTASGRMVDGDRPPPVVDIGKNFTTDELRAIRGVANGADTFAWIVNSICPSIFGHQHVKMGIALGLFGGTKAEELGGGAKKNWLGTDAEALAFFITLYIPSALRDHRFGRQTDFLPILY